MCNHTKRNAIGLDLGGTNLKFGVVSAEGELIRFGTTSVRSEKGKDHILKLMIQAAHECLTFAGENHFSVTAVGIGCPGSIDSGRGISPGPTPHIPNWEDVPLAEIIGDATGLPVFVNNDAKLMTYGEYKSGAGCRYHTVAGITLGTGIGGGIIINGEILNRSSFNAAEFGHMTVEAEGRPCACGNRGCLEQYAGGKFIIRDFIDAFNQGHPSSLHASTDITVKDIITAWRNGDSLATGIMNRALDYLGAGIANIVHSLNPDVIIIGGGIS